VAAVILPSWCYRRFWPPSALAVSAAGSHTGRIVQLASDLVRNRTVRVTYVVCEPSVPYCPEAAYRVCYPVFPLLRFHVSPPFYEPGLAVCVTVTMTVRVGTGIGAGVGAALP
jgi:hypothetical protein